MSDFTTRDNPQDAGQEPAAPDSPPTSHWDELAEQLGAEVSPEALTRVQQPDQGTPQPAPPAKRSTPQRKESKPASPSHWNQLAGTLGITPPPALPEPMAPQAQTGPALEKVRAEEIVDIDEVEDATLDDQNTPIDWDVPPSADTAADEVEMQSEPRSESSAVSAFWSIFGGFASTPPSSEQQPPRLPARDELEDVETVRFSRREGEVSFEEETDLDSAERSSTESDDDEQSESRGRRTRRRRGRRGGRKRRGTSAGQDEASVADDLLPSAELFEDADFGDRDEGDESREAEHALAAEDVVDDDEMDEIGSTVREDAGGRRSHRKIPSWKDAVGIIVTKNLESRTANSGSGSTRRRRGGRRRPSR